MTIDEIIGFAGSLDGVLTLRPAPGDGSPEISWGDTFFYHSPDGTVPTAAQPFATIVTKDYPGEVSWRLDRPGAFRVNIAAGREEFARRTGRTPQEPAAGDEDHGVADTVMAHPVHGSAGWVAVVNPGPRTDGTLRELLRHAHGLARARHERRRAR
ncbi:DUF6194 family protein [Streptomyces sp. NRRL F-2747]|uniref:DUF6194 family protein n=1 Tax=Streptomyces sp. NRRL F-2747 TaxID=1463843 RepID=UPI0004C822F8|nr:DUF6194 family protein [Streptomyces sp. NRRL F-2747]